MGKRRTEGYMTFGVICLSLLMLALAHSVYGQAYMSLRSVREEAVYVACTYGVERGLAVVFERIDATGRGSGSEIEMTETHRIGLESYREDGLSETKKRITCVVFCTDRRNGFTAKKKLTVTVESDASGAYRTNIEALHAV